MHENSSVSDALIGDLAGSLVPVPGVATLIERLFAKVRMEHRRNASVAIQAACSVAGLTREEFAEWVEADPSAAPLLLKVLWAAGMNGHDETLRAIGAVLGRAAHASGEGDADEFQDAELALRAMADLTPRHFLVLGDLASEPVQAQAQQEQTNAAFRPHQIVERTGLGSDTVQQCLLNLANAGLVSQQSAYGGDVYPITVLGKAVVDAASTVAD